MPLLAEVDEAQLDQLVNVVDPQHIHADEWLFRSGEPSDSIYIVDSGRFAAISADGQILAEMASGDSIGDLGVIADAPRSAGVRALRDGVVWKIAADTFSEVLATTPALQSAMLRAMATLLRRSRPAKGARRPRVIGIVSPAEALAAPIVDALVAQLGSHGQTAVVAPPVDAIAHVHNYGELVEDFSETLDRAEHTNDWVLVVADRGCGELWRRYVASQSDRLVVIVTQQRPPETVDALVAQSRPIHLITCLAEPDPRWWELLEPVSQHRADEAGIGALARRIAGRSLGLVLAGGGARGLAHIGVYAELIRAGVVIDRFGGTSAGAIAAALSASGMSPQEAIAAARDLFGRTNPLGDYTIPAVAFTRGGRVDSVIKRYFGDTLIEHLPHEFFSVSADMISGDQVIHRRGRLALAVRASMSIPGLMPPVHHGDQMLVDGGLLNNLPADVMCADPDGEVICVDLRRKFLPSKGFGLLPSALAPPGFVRRLVTGTDAALPPLQETLLRTVDLAASTANLSELPRVAAIIEPDVSAVGVMDFKKIDAAVEAGRSATRAVLEAHPHLAR